jgi:hypothetical protein
MTLVRATTRQETFSHDVTPSTLPSIPYGKRGLFFVLILNIGGNMSICMMYDSFKKMTIPLLLDFGTHVSIGGGGGGGGGGGWRGG